MKLFLGAKAVIVHEGKVLVLHEAHYDEGTNTGMWDVPGGRIEPHEPILEGLRREVREESGLSVSVGRILGVYETFPTIKGEACHIVRVYYECTPIETKVTIGTDHDQYAWISPKDSSLSFVSDLDKVFMTIGAST